MAVKLVDLAAVVRSKNAGPYELTLDILFDTYEDFQLVKNKEVITSARIAQLYGVPREDVSEVIYFEPAQAIKVTLKRPLPAGSPGERDVYGAQQHAPLLEIEI
ncbi:MAG: DUF4387 domain-containing protein [Bacillota bacterium]